ncbi:hypothetical protein K4F52_004611 [Lecanicillium sp. MT-2017a]|nr:hypothetical protein K4F52_004611 [Lecanicillium sp. MT-2017a]
MADLDLPIAVRRARRSNVGIVKLEDDDAYNTTPKTPMRRKRSVRFSDPGPSNTCGLTPFMRRTSVTTPRHRRASTPLRSSSAMPTPPPSRKCSGPAGFLAPIRQTIEGRVARHARRNGFRDMLNKMDDAKRRQAQSSRAEITRLKHEVKTKDREIYELQNATIVIDTERIWDLEQQVAKLKKELSEQADRQTDESRAFDWTMAAKDPFADSYFDMDLDDDHFGDATQAHLHASTPSRARSSFPTPPATSPLIPATPSSRYCFNALTPTSHAGVQACMPDEGRQQMGEEISSLQLEVSKLTATLDSYKNLHHRVTEKITAALPKSSTASADSTIHVVEQKMSNLLECMSDRVAALGQLSASISNLGFPGKDAEEMLTSIASGFRAARLELEYLTPGEITLPLTSHGAEVLDLLLTKLRELAKRSKEDESSIDEYHEIEQSLRKQLDTKVTVMDDLARELKAAQMAITESQSRVAELELGTDRLKGAVNGYIRDISELETLVQQMESDGKEAQASRESEREAEREARENNDEAIRDLENKIIEAVKQTEQLLQDMTDQQDNHARRLAALNKQHGAGLALRDARVMELRVEIDRVNESLRSAHETIRGLRVENGNLKTDMGKQKTQAKEAMDAMKAELQRVLQMSQEFLHTPKRQESGQDNDSAMGSSPVSRTGGLFAAELARRSSSKNLRKRRHDSGLGFLEEGGSKGR